jgi:hypothetical protein
MKGKLVNMEKDLNQTSNCCDALPYIGTEVFDGIAICNTCKEWAEFENKEKQNENKRDKKRNENQV